MNYTYERTFSYTVTVQGLGTTKMSGTDAWDACEKAYVKYMHLEKQRSKYTAVLTYKRR